MNKITISKHALMDLLDVNQQEVETFIELALKLGVLAQGYKSTCYEFYPAKDH